MLTLESPLANQPIWRLAPPFSHLRPLAVMRAEDRLAITGNGLFLRNAVVSANAVVGTDLGRPAIKTVGTSSNVRWETYVPNEIGPRALLWSGVINGTYTGTSPELCGLANNTFSAGQNLISLGCPSEFSLTLNCTIRWGSSHTSRTFDFPDISAMYGVPFSALVYVNNDKIPRFIYKIGSDVVAAAGSVLGGDILTTSFTGARYFYVGSEPADNTTRDTYSSHFLAAVLLGELSADAALELIRNPEQIFAPQQIIIPTPAAAAGGFQAAWARRATTVMGSGLPGG